MELTVLLGVMGILTVIAVYFWLIRKSDRQSPAK